MKPLEQGIGNVLSELLQGGFGFANGGALQGGMPVPFASGGVIQSPIGFPLNARAHGNCGRARCGGDHAAGARRRWSTRSGGRAAVLWHLGDDERDDDRRRQLPALGKRRWRRCWRARSRMGSAICDVQTGSGRSRMSFHEVRFPTGISRASQGGPERRTDVVVLGSGHEERNARWADSRRNYNAGYGVRSLDDLNAVIAFFEERRGRLHGFRWRDPADWKSCPPEQMATAARSTDRDWRRRSTAVFQLSKTYGQRSRPGRASDHEARSMAVCWWRSMASTAWPGTHLRNRSCDGQRDIPAGHVPALGAAITAGFAFDVPARFDTDRLEINLQGFRHGAIPEHPDHRDTRMKTYRRRFRRTSRAVRRRCAGAGG